MQSGLTASKLTAKQEALCLEYVNSFHATAAASQDLEGLKKKN